MARGAVLPGTRGRAGDFNNGDSDRVDEFDVDVSGTTETVESLSVPVVLPALLAVLVAVVVLASAIGSEEAGL